MAHSKFEYVRKFETNEVLLPNTWIVVRIDGRTFHKFTADHDFAKPNEKAALELMDRAALSVFEAFPDIIMGYGQSDEYSFVLRPSCNMFSRRSVKIATAVSSMFAAAYVFHWPSLMSIPLKYPPCFDGRCVAYPTEQNLRDYLSWRQADCHINNLYNTCFWKLVHDGQTPEEAEKTLCGTVAAEKNEILFQRGVNYNNIDPMFRKGSFVYKKLVVPAVEDAKVEDTSVVDVPAIDAPVVEAPAAEEGEATAEATVAAAAAAAATVPPRQSAKKSKKPSTEATGKRVVVVEYVDIISAGFWRDNAYLLKP